MLRLGIVGSESSHVDDYLDLLNVRAVFPGVRVTSLCGDDPRAISLARHASVSTICGEPADLIGRVDAALVVTRHASQHAGQALPLLAAGIPVFVDKPFTASVEDALRLVSAAASGKTVVTSYSAVRWVPDMVALLSRIPSLGEVCAVSASGGADPKSPYDGLWFYGVHVVEALLQVLQAEGVCDPILDCVTSTTTATTAVGHSGSVSVQLALCTPECGTVAPFTVHVIGRHGTVTQTIGIGKDYLLPGLERFLHLVRAGIAPLTEGQLLAPVRLLHEITRTRDGHQSATRQLPAGSRTEGPIGPI